MEIVGTRGFKGKKTKNANTMFNNLFETVEEDDEQDPLDIPILENEELWTSRAIDEFQSKLED
jgi:hypothetical protein